MKFVSQLMIVGVCTCLSATAFGQGVAAEAPATQPAVVEAAATTMPMVDVPASTQPAFVADQTTPRGAAVLLARAMSKGDVEAATALVVADDLQVKYIKAIAGMTLGMRDLYDASLEKFGNDVELLRIPAPNDSAEQQMLAATVEENGDKAMITIQGSPQGMPLVKVDGKWHVDMGKLINPNDMTSSIPLLTTVGEIAGKTAVEVKAGKYDKIEDVQMALQTKMNAAIMGAQTQPVITEEAPTTAPAGPEAPAMDAPEAPVAPEMSAPAEAPAAPAAPDMPAAPATQPM